jgi:hypothetical protein
MGFNVTLNQRSDIPVSVTYSTADGSATTGSDYVAKTDLAYFPPGVTSVGFGILVIGDQLHEGDETFYVNLSDPVGATIADGQGVGTILDDDPFSLVADSLPGMNQGSVAWGDYDNDGDLDLLLTGTTDGTAAGAIARLYHNDAGTFALASTTLPGTYGGYGGVWGDYDNDGDLDILLSGKVYRNDGGAVFTDIGATLLGVANSSAAWGDYDNDGDLDILIASWVSGTKLYRNNGGGAFVEVATALPAVSGSALAWGDYDNDGDLDILLTGYAGNIDGRISSGRGVRFSRLGRL